MRYTKVRADWENPAERVSGPQWSWAKIDTIAIHYTAADDLIDGDIGENWDGIPQYIRDMQHAYLTQRGFSLGYSVIVDQRGWTWEVRGTTYRAAANLGWNERTFAILVLVDGNDSAWPGAVDAIRDLVAQVRLVKPNVQIVGHKDIGATACPGLGLYAQIHSGVFEPVPEPEPTPDPVEDEDMKPVVTRWSDGAYDIIVFADEGNTVFRWRGCPNANELVAAGLAVDKRSVALPATLKTHGIFLRDERNLPDV